MRTSSGATDRTWLNCPSSLAQGVCRRKYLWDGGTYLCAWSSSVARMEVESSSGKSLVCLVSNLRRLGSDELVLSWRPRGLKSQAQKARLRGVARCSELELCWPELGLCWLGGLDRVNG